MTDRPARTLDKFIVRLPDGMREQLADAARANGRSMTAEVVARLQRTFELDEAGAKPGWLAKGMALGKASVPSNAELKAGLDALTKRVAKLEKVR